MSTNEFGIEPFSTEQRRANRARATGELNSHTGHKGKTSTRAEIRENCGACGLQRLDYAGWPLVYMAAGKEMPPAEFARELAVAQEENPGYFRNLIRHAATYGIKLKGK